METVEDQPFSGILQMRIDLRKSASPLLAKAPFSPPATESTLVTARFRLTSILFENMRPICKIKLRMKKSASRMMSARYSLLTS